jgi:hypothetical protein
MIPLVALAPQPGSHASDAIVWRLRILFIEEPHQLLIFRTLPLCLVVIGRPGQAQQVTLPGDAELRMSGSIKPRLASGNKSSVFFHPVQRDFELSDLLV